MICEFYIPAILQPTFNHQLVELQLQMFTLSTLLNQVLI